MFCSKCGEKLGDDVVFCPKCGTKIANDANNSNQSTEYQSAPVQKKLKHLMILSIIGFAISLIGVVGTVINNFEIVFGIGMTYYIFIIIYAIVLLVISNKFKLKTIKVMAIIDLVYSSCVFFVLLMEDGMIVVFTCMIYTAVLSLVSFLQSLEKNDT